MYWSELQCTEHPPLPSGEGRDVPFTLSQVGKGTLSGSLEELDVGPLETGGDNDLVFDTYQRNLQQEVKIWLMG